MQKKLGFLGIVISNRKKCAPEVNQILTQHGDIIAGRMGLPFTKKECWVVTVVVDATEDELNVLVSELSKVDGVLAHSTFA